MAYITIDTFALDLAFKAGGNPVITFLQSTMDKDACVVTVCGADGESIAAVIMNDSELKKLQKWIRQYRRQKWFRGKT